MLVLYFFLPLIRPEGSTYVTVTYLSLGARQASLEGEKGSLGSVSWARATRKEGKILFSFITILTGKKQGGNRRKTGEKEVIRVVGVRSI